MSKFTHTRMRHCAGREFRPPPSKICTVGGGAPMRAVRFAFVLLVLLSAPAAAREPAPPASRWTATDPPINLVHIEKGEINRRGEAVGYHHRPNDIDPPGAKVLRITQPPDASGVSRARAALSDPAPGEWIDKRASSTFFPDTMSEAAVIQAVLAALRDGAQARRLRVHRRFGTRLYDRRLVPIGADCRRLPAARPLMPLSRIADAGLITARRHPAGHLEARAVRGSARRGEVLASFLQSDVQGDLEMARALLIAIGGAEPGPAPQPAAIGNAYSISLSREGITIRNAVISGSRPERYDFDEMRRALGIWIAAIERARRNPV